MTDDTWMKLSTEEKCVHKTWKARSDGYENALRRFQEIKDPKSPEFSNYLGLVRKFVTDGNAIALEKAVEATLLFVQKAAVAPKSAGEVVSGIIAKCISSPRAKTREFGVEIIMTYIEIEKQEVVQEELIKGLANKQPKIVTACINILKDSLSEFGSKIILIKPMLKLLQKMLEDRDKNVRESGKQLIIEMYKWIGAAFMSHLSFLKPVQLTELEQEFEGIPAGKPTQRRFLRSQQDLKRQIEEAEENGTEEPEQEVEEEEDLFESIVAVDILSKLPKDYYKNLESAKWQERKEGLTACENLVKAPKFESGDYHDLIKTLKIVISKDKNVMLVLLAVKCLGNLARGLKKSFTQYAIQCLDILLDKCKEKKVAVIVAIRESLDHIYATSNLDSMSESLATFLEHKNPGVKSETALFLSRCFSSCSQKTIPKKLLKVFIMVLLKTINDTTPEVRESSYKAIGMLLKVLGEKPLLPFLADIDSIKMAKIKDICDKSESSQNGNTDAKKSNPASKTATKTSAEVAKKKPATSRPGTAKSSAASRPTSAKSSAKPGTAKAKSKKNAPAASNEFTENILTDETVTDQVSAILPANAIANLYVSNWKDRLEAVENIKSCLEKLEKEKICSQALIRTIVTKPGLKDTNFQVLKNKIDIIRIVADTSDVSKTSLTFCINLLVDKIADPKCGANVYAALTSLSENLGLGVISLDALTYAFEQKNPKVQMESLNWMANALKEFGLKVEVKKLVVLLRKALAATNPTVKMAALNMFGVLYTYVGQPLRTLFEGDNATLLSLMDTTITKFEGETVPAVTRFKRGESAQVKDDNEDGDGDGEDAGSDADDMSSVQDLVTRICIKDNITEKLISEMKDKNWKVRDEALTNITRVIAEAKFITSDIGQDLIPALVLRMADTNKNLITNALAICQSLSNAMGPGIKQHIKAMSPGIISTFADSKPTIRKAGYTTLSDWIVKATLNTFLECEVLANELLKGKPNLKIEVLGLLKEQLTPPPKRLSNAALCELEACVVPFFACIEDRNPDVRKAATDLMVPLMTSVGFSKMAKKVTSVKPSSRSSITALLEKSRESVPDKPAKVAPSKAAPSKAASSKVASSKSNSEQSATTKTTSSAAPAKKTVGKRIINKAPAKRAKKEEIDEGLMLSIVAGSKEQRIKDEKNLKVLKWNFTTPRTEFLDQLKNQMAVSIGKTLIEQMFHSNFKFHLKAIETLSKELNEGDSTISNIDMILKWLTLRFFDTNTTVFIKILDYTKEMFGVISEQEYLLSDIEAASFIPYLINKVGDPKDNIRKSIRQIFSLLTQIYSPSKFFQYVIDGLKSKNSKQRTECLEEISHLLNVQGISVCSSLSNLKVVASQISDRDNPVRSAALNAIVSAYMILQDNVYKHIGRLPDKEMGMLEERIKRSVKVPVGDNNAAVSEPVVNTRPKTAGKKAANDRKSVVIEPEQAKVIVASVRPTEDIGKQEYKDFVYESIEKDDETGAGDIDDDDSEFIDESLGLFNKMYGNTLVKEQNIIRSLLSEIASPQYEVSFLALSKIYDILQNKEKHVKLYKLLVDDYETFTTKYLEQVIVIVIKHTAEAEVASSTPNYDIIYRLYRNIMACLNEFSKCDKYSYDIIKSNMFAMFIILSDTRINKHSEYKILISNINTFIVKLMNDGDITNVICSLVEILKNSLDNNDIYDINSLTLRAIWRMTRILKTEIYNIDISDLLASLDTFMIAYPLDYWENKSDSRPLRTMKTIIYSMIQLIGKDILKYLDKIKISNSSEILEYIRTSLETIDKQKNADNIEYNIKKQLIDIFTCIKSKDKFQQGVRELYEFKQKHQKVSIDSLLKSCNKNLQTALLSEIKLIESHINIKKSSGINLNEPKIETLRLKEYQNISKEYIANNKAINSIGSATILS